MVFWTHQCGLRKGPSVGSFSRRWIKRWNNHSHKPLFCGLPVPLETQCCRRPQSPETAPGHTEVWGHPAPLGWAQHSASARTKERRKNHQNLLFSTMCCQDWQQSEALLCCRTQTGDRELFYIKVMAVPQQSSRVQDNNTNQSDTSGVGNHSGSEILCWESQERSLIKETSESQKDSNAILT